MCFIRGDSCLDKRVERIVEESTKEIELNVGSLVPVGTEFKGCKVDLYNGMGVYKGPDNLYYKVRYDVFNNTLIVEDISEREIEF